MPPHCSHTVTLRCAPKTFPCPTCGRHGRRKTVCSRTVIDFHHGQLRYVQLYYGECRAQCPCCQTFRSHPATERLPLQPRAHYSDRVRELLLARLWEDGLSGEHARASLQRDFGLELSEGYLYDCLAWKVRQVNMADYRTFTRDRFSGTLCVDEVHLGQRILLLATDPLNELVIGFALVSRNDQDHMLGFLKNLKTQGIRPKLIITDGSNLYPQVIHQLWPKAKHQLCTFHLLMDLNKELLDALRRLRQQAFPKVARRGRRGRPGRLEQDRVAQQQEQQERSKFIWQHRYLLVKRPEHYEGADAQHFAQMCHYLPALRELRTVALELMTLFDPALSHRAVWYRYRQWYASLERLTDEKLKRALRLLKPQKFRKAMAYRLWSHQRQTRTNNHVERMNRRVRFWEKVRYRWRQRRTIIRFVILILATWYEAEQQRGPTPKKRLQRRRKRVK